MNFRLVFKLTGKVLLVESCAMVLPLLVGFFYGDNPMPFLVTIPLLAAVGLVLRGPALLPMRTHSAGAGAFSDLR